MAIYRRFRVQQKYVNGQPTEEYRLGVEVDGTNYHSLEACKSGSECTELEYRWVDMELASDYYCEGTNKYKKQKKQQKCVNEETWTDVYPYEYRAGEIIEYDSEDCGYNPTGEYHIYGATDGHGSINISPSKEYYSSTDVVTITALPSTDYMFSCYNYGRNLNYGSVTYSSVLSLTMSNNWYVSAVFKSAQYKVYDLTTVGGSLTISPSKEYYNKGDVITITNTPGLNYAFSYYKYGSTNSMLYSTTSKSFTSTISNDFYVSGVFSISISSGTLYYSYLDGTESFIPWSSRSLNASHNNGSNAVIIRDTTGIIDYVTGFSENRAPNIRYLEFVSVSVLFSYTFENCSNLSYVSLPYVSRIASYAFKNCTNLNYVYLSRWSGLSDTDYGIFYGCVNLQDVYLLSSDVVSLWRETFSSCPSNIQVHVPEKLCEIYNYTYRSKSFQVNGGYKTASELFDCMSTEPIPQQGCLYVEYSNSSSWYNPSVSELSRSDYYSAKMIKDYCGTIKIVPPVNSSSNRYYKLRILDLPSVSSVGAYGFYSASSLWKVSMPELTYIGNYGFCSAPIINAYMPKLSYVGAYGFYDKYAASIIDFPNLEYIGGAAFYGADNLEIIDLSKCSYIGYRAFLGCLSLSFVNLSNCLTVGEKAFDNCYMVKTMHLPKVTYFGSDALSRMTRLETLYMDQITSVPSGYDPNINTSHSKSIVIPCSLFDDFINHSIWGKYSSFYVCPEIKELFTSTDGGGTIVLDPEGGKYYSGTTVNITYKNAPGYMLNCFQYGSTPAYGLTEINESFSLVMSQNWYVSARFDYNGGLYYSYVDGTYSYFRWLSSSISKGYNSGTNASTIIDYSSHITYVGDFSNLRSLTMVSFPNAVTLESYAFSDCVNLSEVDMPNLEYIGSGAFTSTKITDAYFPNAEYIGSGAFQWTRSLESAVLIKANRLNGYTFKSCYSLTTVNIPKVSVIGAYEFDSCYDLENLNAPLVESIGAYAFRSCHRLGTIDFEKVSYVGGHAFTGCLFTTAVLPNALSIGSYAFEGCSYLSELYLTNVSKATVAGSNIFSGCDRIQTVYIPCSLVEDFCSLWNSASWSLFSCIGSHIECTLSWTTWVYSYRWTSSSSMYRDGAGHAIWYTKYSRKTTPISVNYNDYIITPSSPWYMLDTVQFSTRHNYILESDTFLITRQSMHVSLYMDQYVLWYSTDGTSSFYTMSQEYYRTGYLGSSSWENCGVNFSNINSLPSDAVTVYLYDQEIVRIDDYGLPESNNLETLYIGRSFDNASKQIYDEFFKYASKLTSIYIRNNSKTYFISGSNNYIRYSTRLSQGGIYVSSSLLSYYQQNFNYISNLFKATDI